MTARHAELVAALEPAVLGARLRAAREARGMTQTDLADGRVSVGYVSRIERGERRPTAAVLAGLVELLGVSLDDLLHDERADAREEVRLGLDYVELALESGQALDAERAVRDHLDRATEHGLGDLVARGRLLLARSLEALGDLDAAITELEALVATADGVLLVQAGLALSRCHRAVGDASLAVEVGEALAPRLEESGLDRTDEGVQLAMTVALAHVELGNLSRAARVCAAAVARAEEMDTPMARAAAYWNSSIVYSERGEIPAALELARRALALLGEGRESRNLAWLRLETGRLQMLLDPADPAAALEQVERGREGLVWSSASSADLARGDVMLASILVRLERADEAVELARRARESFAPEMLLELAEVHVVLGEALLAAGRTDEARAAFEQALVHLDRFDRPDRLAAQLWYELADLLDEMGDADATRRALLGAGRASGLRSRTRTPLREHSAPRT